MEPCSFNCNKELAMIVLFDVAKVLPKEKLLDIAQSSSVDGFNVKLSGTSNYEDTKIQM